MRRRLLVMGSVLLLVLGVEGCTWDSSLYDTYARNDSVTSCPPGKIATDSENNKYIDLNTVKCYAQDIVFKPDKGALSILENNDVQMDLECVDENQNCIVYNDGDTQNKERCRNCALYIEDYRMCRALQDFKDIFAEDNVTMPSIDFIADYTPTKNLRDHYPDAGKYRICPSDYGKCYYHKDDSESERGQFGCVSSCPSTMVECAGQCIDPKTNTKFCGAQGDCSGDNAGKPCDEGLSCVDGTCQLVCTKDQIVCNGQCINPAKDDEHCGAKGTCDAEENTSDNYRGEECSSGLKCVEGQCILECLEGQIKCPAGDNIAEKEKRCVNPLSDNEYCGATSGCVGAQKCMGGQSCSGTCRCPAGMELCDDNCVDLRYSNQYCGSCDNKCNTNESCIDRVCVKTGCEDKNETLCTHNNTCVDLDNSFDDCGACGSSCKDHPMPHAKAIGCKEGKCQYECVKDGDVEYTMCDGECVDTLSNAKYCKNKDTSSKCGGQCPADHYCDKGECKKSSCNNACLVNGECINKAVTCGTQCENCIDKNTQDAACTENGLCDAKVCMNGYHLAQNTNLRIHECLQNTPKACGSTDAVDSVDCEAHFYDENNLLKDGYESAACVQGKCQLTCKPGYYATEDHQCLEYDAEHCNGVNCNNQYINSKDTRCNNGVCELVSCADGYHITMTNEGSVCDVNTNAVCGKPDTTITYDCTQLSNSNKTCLSSGECSCKNGYSFVVDQAHGNKPYCVTEITCGDVKCEELEGWLTGGCEANVQPYNVCDAYSCQTGYGFTRKTLNDYYFQGVCVKNTNESCSISKYYEDEKYNKAVSCTSMGAVCDMTYGLCYRASDKKYYCQRTTMKWRNLSDCKY